MAHRGGARTDWWYASNSSPTPEPTTTVTATAAPKVDEFSGHVDKKWELHRKSFGAIVEIKVGASMQIFRIHKQLLCDVSLFFTAALNGEFKEAKSQIIELPEEDPAVFEHFQLWIYSGFILEAKEPVKDVEWDILLGLYLFGEMIAVMELQNAVLDQFIFKEISSKEVPTYLLHRVYDNTQEGCSLRRLMVDFFTYGIKLNRRTWCANDAKKARFPKEYLFDLIVLLYEKENGVKAKTVDFKKARSD